MKRASMTVLALAATLATGSAFAQQTYAPGQRMQSEGSVSGTPGASGYAPGKEMQKHGSKSRHGASAYAPGRTTGSASGSARSRHTTGVKAGAHTSGSGAGAAGGAKGTGY